MMNSFTSKWVSQAYAKTRLGKASSFQNIEGTMHYSSK